MKVISIWQPYAELLIRGFKRIETRGFPAPASLVGQRLGIASTKIVKPEQTSAFDDEEFSEFYKATELPGLPDLKHGYLLGTVLLHTCDPITEEDLEDVTDEEQSFGWWEVGRFAWRCRDPQPFDEPIPVRGQQGIWTYQPPSPVHHLKQA